MGVVKIPSPCHKQSSQRPRLPSAVFDEAHGSPTVSLEAKEKSAPKIEVAEIEVAGFDVTKIPSPCRKRSSQRAAATSSGDRHEGKLCNSVPDDASPPVQEDVGSQTKNARQRSSPNACLGPATLRMLQNSGTPQKHLGTPQKHRVQSGKFKMNTPSAEEGASRHAAAFDAWGVSPSESK